MIRKEILEELEKMNDEERLEVIEAATRLLRAGQRPTRARPDSKGRKRRLREAAELMRDEYAAGGDLTALTALDAEDFHDG